MVLSLYMRKKVLIVEDNPDLREAIVQALTNHNYEVLIADNGQLGLKIALRDKPDLIVLDLMMPKMGGQETLKKLRQDPWGKDVRVLILTSLDDVQNIGHTHEKGIVDYIIKTDASLADIVRKISTAIHVD